MILERIHSPADVKALSFKDLSVLCQELRSFLVETVSHTGGHLASNLGVVELSVAIHRVFDTASDRLVFDVGHQCYVHKALTGRRELFSTLRQFGGLSGFPKPCESVHDAFIAGHASNSVSVALGMARARTLLHQDYSVLALIGDGALTGGLAYEGLNNAGASGEPLIVIVNDNGMSISPNVGGLTAHLNHLRTRPVYYHFKKWYHSLYGKNAARHPVYQTIHSVKSTLKKLLLPGSTLFEDMGFSYLGPVDGHDLERLCVMLKWAKELRRPVVLHVQTEKGRGYFFAERNPDRFHGVSPFDRKTGLSYTTESRSFSGVFGEALTQYAGEDARVCAITAAMKDGTGLAPFAAAWPERFFDVAIAEGHGVTMAAGLASQGMIPVFAVYSTFLQRSVDMLIHDAALQHLHVVLGVDRSGLVGADGETHHGCFDALFLPAIPGFTVLAPSNFAELRSMLRQALFAVEGPVAVRYPRGSEGVFRTDVSGDAMVCLWGATPWNGREIQETQADTEADRQTEPPDTENPCQSAPEIALVSYGILINTVLEAADRLSLDGISAQVWKLNQIAPLDPAAVRRTLGGKRVVLVLEDCFRTGSVGERIGALLCEGRMAPERMILQNLGTSFAPAGRVSQLEQKFHLDAAGVVDAIREAVKESGKRR